VSTRPKDLVSPRMALMISSRSSCSSASKEHALCL
jgi:hypothetical protein